MNAARKTAVLLMIAGASLRETHAAPAAAILEGTVTQHGSPLHGASVTIASGSTRTCLKSDVQGKYRLSEIPPGDARLEVERTGNAYMLRISREVKIASAVTHTFDFDLWLGECVVSGTLSNNGAPVEGGSALVVARLPDGSKLRVCALTDKSGSYRIDGLPAGAHELHLDPRPTILPIAIARMRKSTHDVNLTLFDGTQVRQDYNLATGRVVAQLKGLRVTESGRFVLVSGEFTGPRLSANNVGIMLRHAVATKTLTNDDTIVINDLETGSYTAFFAAYDRGTGSVRQAFRTMRLAYEIVSVAPGAKTDVVLEFE